MSAATVVTRGYGSFGIVSFVPTRGYGDFIVDSPITPEIDLTNIPANRTVYITKTTSYRGTGS